MGQHKFNKTAIEAKEGKLQPKVKRKKLNPNKLKIYLRYYMMGLTPEQFLGSLKFNKEYVQFVKDEIELYKSEHPDKFKEPEESEGVKVTEIQDVE